MMKVIGLVVFVTFGLFAFAREVPAAQGATGATSSQISDEDLAVRAPQFGGCPSSTPICCEPAPGGGCLVCIPRGTQCP